MWLHPLPWMPMCRQSLRLKAAAPAPWSVVQAPANDHLFLQLAPHHTPLRLTILSLPGSCGGRFSQAQAVPRAHFTQGLARL